MGVNKNQPTNNAVSIATSIKHAEENDGAFNILLMSQSGRLWLLLFVCVGVCLCALHVPFISRLLWVKFAETRQKLWNLGEIDCIKIT